LVAGEGPLCGRTRVAVRSAAETDEEAVIALWRACNLTVSYNDPIADFRFACGKPASDVLVAVDAEAVIGSVMVGHDGHRGWLWYVAVDPARRKQGIGRTLVEAAEDWLRQRGAPKVHLMVRETNTEVIEFYARMGYDPMPRVNMQKWLK
jgi:ribosomal protein S18 acetylase RimI-like enzyme